MRVDITAVHLAPGDRFYIENPDDIMGHREYLLTVGEVSFYMGAPDEQWISVVPVAGPVRVDFPCDSLVTVERDADA